MKSFCFQPSPLSGKDQLVLHSNEKFCIKTDEDAKYFATTTPLTILERYLETLSSLYYEPEDSSCVELVDDNLYDIMRDILANRNPRSKYLAKIGATPISKDSVNLPFPMSSLEKIKEIDGNDILIKYLARYKDCPSFVVSDKLDGVSAQLCVDKDGKMKMYSQTSETQGKDISHLIKNVFHANELKNIPPNTTIRGELILTKDHFREIQQEFPGQYKNARNTVA